MELWVVVPTPLMVHDSSLDHLGPIVLLELEGYQGIRLWGCTESIPKEGENNSGEFSYFQMPFLGGQGTMRCENPDLFGTVQHQANLRN